MGFDAVVKPEDLAKFKPVVPGWFPIEIVDYAEEPTKDKPGKKSDGSLNAIITFKVLDGPMENKDRKIKRYFNEKALGFGDALWCVLFPNDWKKGVGGKLNSQMLRSVMGKKMEGYLEMSGEFPDIKDYRPLGVK